jgi:uncharacterized protein (DUF4415 family)
MTELTEQQQAELQALAEMSDDEIDLSDIPYAPVDWSKAQRGLHYNPTWLEVTIRLDEQVVAWFEEHTRDPERLHRHINQVLVEHIRRQKKIEEESAKEAAN